MLLQRRREGKELSPEELKELSQARSESGFGFELRQRGG